MKKILYQSFLIFCVLYTIATLISSTLQLFQGREFDTNIHLLDRGAVAIIGVCALQLIRLSKFKSKILNIAIPYCISMGLVFLYVYISGFFNELHPDAYRDIFLNYTIAFVVVISAIKIFEHIRNKRNKQE